MQHKKVDQISIEMQEDSYILYIEYDNLHGDGDFEFFVKFISKSDGKDRVIDNKSENCVRLQS